MSSFDIPIILGNKDKQLPKPINNRPGIHRSHMAICLDRMKLTKIDDVKPRKSFDYGLYKRFGERNYKKRPESLASQIWNAVRNDNTPNGKEFLGLNST
nr:8180_t:CDS:2 [Entrophospora candida]